VSRTPLVVVGDLLLDRDVDGPSERLCPDAPAPVIDDPAETARPGGAGLAAALAAAGGREVVLVAAVARDAGGARLRSLLAERGVELQALPLAGATPEKVRVCAGGRPLARIDRGGTPGRVGAPDAAILRRLRTAPAVLVSDYGRGVGAEPEVRAALAARRPARPLVWDPHPRGAAPTPGAHLVTPNGGEARRLLEAAGGPARGPHPPADDGVAAWSARAQAVRELLACRGAAITLGPRGAVYAEADRPAMWASAVPVTGGDPVGAGDAFAAAVAGLMADGALGMEAVSGAVAAAGAFVAAGGARVGAAASMPAVGAGAEDAAGAIARIRAAGGRVVATGGCFDLLHAGHVAMLEAARALGDGLVVLLNSDASVRRLKGPDRPLVPEADRAAVLRGLRAVDAVEVFEEDTPVPALERLRPDVFAKGADYAVADLPEAAAMRRLGGEAVVVPFVAGRSTTRLIEEVAIRGTR
jgi:D-beta-D-heptose 7-phosphate kinase / D-beta-D-heptose 1-phosphate adenosyltransferase